MDAATDPKFVQGPVPPPPKGCRAEDSHIWKRTDIVSNWSENERLLWYECETCSKQRFVVDSAAAQ